MEKLNFYSDFNSKEKAEFHASCNAKSSLDKTLQH